MRKLPAVVLASQLLMMVPPLPCMGANEAEAPLPASLPDAVQSGTGGLLFDGVDDYITFGPAASTLGASNFTLEIWFKRTGTGQFANTGNGGLYAVPLVTKGRGETDGDTRDMNYFLGIDASGVLVADFEEGVGGSGPLGLNHPVIGHSITTTGVWYHAAVTYDGTNWALYLNGNIETNLFVGRPPRWDSIQHAALGSALNSTGAPQGFFQGILDEARIWNHARSAEQIAASMDQQIGSAPGLMGRWSLNEGSGTIAGNSVGGGLDGTLVNERIWCLGYPFAPGTNSFPDVAIVNPPNGSTFSSGTNLIISADASDVDGTVTSVAFMRDDVTLGIVTNRPFSLDWSSVAVGNYALTAIATDDGGLTTTSPVVNVSAVATNYSPTLETLNFPHGGATNISLSPALSVTVSDPETNNITVTFFGRVFPQTPDFTIVVLPDTQYYSKSYPDIFQSQIDWIINNRTNLNIVYVASLGDITDDGSCQGYRYEWANATNALYRLENPELTSLPEGIPYGVVPGNHDHECGTGLYNIFFNGSHFAEHSYYGGHLGNNNQNHYDLIGAGGMDFVIVYMDFDYGYPDVNYSAIDAWANSVLQSNANRRAIVVSHCILRADGTYDDNRSPSVYSGLKGNPNLFLMLCGHNYREAWRQDTYLGQTITTCLSDYQFDPNGGNGLLRLYQFSPTNNLVRVTTYSPYLDQYETDANSQFEFEYQMEGNGSYFVIGSTNVPSGSTANLTWSGLTPDTEYEWYVTLDDGTNTVTGPSWRFTTTANGSNSAPIVALNQPVNGAIVVAGSDIIIEATASDGENFVTEVDFFANGVNLGSASGPYNLIWSNLVAGVYNLTAIAYDSGGSSGTSTPVTVIVTNVPSITNILVASGSTWKYLDNGSNPGSSWIDLAFDDNSWAAGPAELGYGDAAKGRPEATVVSYGPDPDNKYVTTYFRQVFVVTNAANVTALNLYVVRDDGIVVYLNGAGIYTNNMPDTFAYDTYAPDSIDEDDEHDWQIASLLPDHLQEGTNIVAVEIHQANARSSDISFDLQLNSLRPGVLNLPPVANDQNTNVAADATLAFALSGTDLNGDLLSYTVTVRPTHGLLDSFSGQTGLVTYRPAHGFVGTDTFHFVVCDGVYTSIAATVTMQVTALADSDNNSLPDAWEVAHGIADPDADDDHDGLTNSQEYEAGTDPQDAASAFYIAEAYCNSSNGWFTITWPSVGGTRYRVCYSNGDQRGSFTGQFMEIGRPADLEIAPEETGMSSTQTFTDDFTLTVGPPASGARYFRVKIAH